MRSPPASSPDPALHDAVAAALSRAPSRVHRIEVGPRVYWIKRPENLDLRMRLQKGNPSRAWMAERDALHALAARGAPVTPIAHAGADYFVTPDAGRTLWQLLRDPAVLPADRLAAFHAGGAALARLHKMGLSHGRPMIKDIAWDGARATLMDLERYSPHRNTLRGHAHDLVILVFSALAATGAPTAESDALIAGYRAHDRAQVWQAAAAWCYRMRAVRWLTRPLQGRRRGAREFNAVPLTLAAFGVR